MRGVAVLLDVVYNHLGPAGNHLEHFGPYFTDRYRTPWGKAVNLDDAGSAEVRRFLIDNALMWLRDYHVDGLRLDAVHAIFDQSAVHFLEQLALEVSSLESHLGRRLILIAESDLNDPRLVRSREAGGYGLDAQWSDDFHHAMHALLAGERAGYYADFGSMEHLDRSLHHVFVYAGHESEFRQRRHGRPAVGLPGTRFLGYLQNHDQVGNRARGDRSSHLMTEGRLRIGAALVLTAPFVPMLFQGEEWAATSPFQYFADHEDPELARAVRVGRREEFAAFGWNPEDVPDPQDEQTFRRSKLDWSEHTQEPHAGMLEWHRRLIAYRRKMPELTDGRMDRVETHMDQRAGSFLMRRGRVALAFNIGKETQRVELPEGTAALALASAASVCLFERAVELPPDTVAVLEIGQPTRRVADGA
jgi:maltooligosyltrehalose trehalohydrolase